MDRLLMKDLLSWKYNPNRKPLIINGARQVGKTWLLKEFGKTHFDNYAYINFDNDKTAKSFFDGDFDVNRILKAISLHTKQTIKPNKTLVIFDEIQSTPKAITSLKYFCENASQYAIVAAGSLLGLQQHSGTGWPVGKINALNLYPMSFLEFIDALNNKDLLQIINNADVEMMSIFKDKLIDLLKQYYCVGGMPEVVLSFVLQENYENVRKIQNQILDDYKRDFSKHIPPNILPRTIEAWDSIVGHLAQENKKFVFGHIRTGARSKQYEKCLSWLEEAGLIYKVNRISKPGIPLKSYADNVSFKVFLLDVGLLNAMAGVSPDVILKQNKLFTEFKGALTEQYVCQQLISSCNFQPYYWSAQNSIGEVDFVIQNNEDIYAIEVKAEENLRSQSLLAFCKKYRECKALRFSLSNYRDQDWMKNIPLYACMNRISY